MRLEPTMSTTTVSSSLVVSPVLMQSTVMGNDTYLYNTTPSMAGNSTGDESASIAEFESYTLYKVTEVMAQNYLWVLLAFGLPGNIASIYTILSMATVSSSKVNMYVLRHRTGGVGTSSNQNRRYDTEVSSSNEIQRDQKESISANKSSRYNNMVFHTTIVGRLKSLQPVATAHVAILAVTDSVAIISKVVHHQVSGDSFHVPVFVCSIVMFIPQFATVYANWVVVAMTAERFLAVWFPLRVGRMYTRRKALIVLACLGVVSAGLYLFHFWAWKLEYQEGFGYYCRILPYYEENFLPTFNWIDACFSIMIPCILILVGNALIIINIKRAKKAQRHLTNAFDQGGRKARDQRQITVMLIVVSIVFLLLNVPNAIFYIVRDTWRSSFQGLTYEDLEFRFTARFIHLLSDANHAVNFYLYFLSMASFRRRFIDAVRCRSRMARRPASSSIYRTSQTYLHGVHHSNDSTRPDSNSMYSAYKRSSGNIISDGPHSMKTYNNNSNSGVGNNMASENNHHTGTASSEV